MKAINVVLKEDSSGFYTIPAEFFRENQAKIFKYISDSSIWNGCFILILDTAWQTRNVGVTIAPGESANPDVGTMWHLGDFRNLPKDTKLVEVTNITLTI